MVPLVAKVTLVVSQPTLRYSDWITVTVAGPSIRVPSGDRPGGKQEMLGFAFWNTLAAHTSCGRTLPLSQAEDPS